MQTDKPERLIRLPEVKNITGLSCSEIYKRMAEGTFQRPIKLGKSSVAWVASEVQEWVAVQIAASRNKSEVLK